MPRPAIPHLLPPRLRALAARERAWARLARDLDAGALESVANDIGLAEAAGVGPDVLAGKIKGRLVVDVNK